MYTAFQNTLLQVDFESDGSTLPLLLPRLDAAVRSSGVAEPRPEPEGVREQGPVMAAYDLLKGRGLWRGLSRDWVAQRGLTAAMLASGEEGGKDCCCWVLLLVCLIFDDIVVMFAVLPKPNPNPNPQTPFTHTKKPNTKLQPSTPALKPRPSSWSSTSWQSPNTPDPQQRTPLLPLPSPARPSPSPQVTMDPGTGATGGPPWCMPHLSCML
jgi:hypothetical protein